MADPSVVDAACTFHIGCSATKHLDGCPRAEPSVVDSGEARDPGLAGALNTLREHLPTDYLGPDPNDMDGEKWGQHPEALAALAVVKTALADRDRWIQDATDRLGDLVAFGEATQRAQHAEARAVAAEAERDEAWFERVPVTLANGQEDYTVWCRRCGVHHQRPQHCPARRAVLAGEEPT